MGVFFTLLINSVNNIDIKIKQNIMPRLFFALLLLPAFLQNLPACAQPALPAGSAAPPFTASAAPPRAGSAAQTPAAPPSILDNYIRTGLDSNLALHQ